MNLLTHLESQRVYYLVTHDKMSVRAAKKKAQHEIFDAFHIDTTGFKTESEDMDVFGATAADAALLAISILLQGDGDETSSQHYKLQARGFEEWPDATDAYGFTALPFGAYKNEFDRYNQKMAYFWCSDEYDYEMAGYMFLQPDRLDHGGIYKDRGLSVRCLKDD